MSGDHSPIDPRALALDQLVRFVREHHPYADHDDAARILMLIVMRGNNTALAIANLIAVDSTEQGQMLCRSLFEDMAVAHWLVMQDDPTLLVDRFFAHQDAMAVYEYDYANNEMGLPYEGAPWMGDALDRRDELRGQFGERAQRPWWGVRPDGKEIKLDGVVAQLQTHEAYSPRLHGGAEPALKNAYALANKWANEQLHCTPNGMPLVLVREGMMTRNRERTLYQTAANAFWIFGQLAYLQLEYGSDDPALLTEFDGLFQRLMSEVFAGGMTVPEVEHALGDLRAQRGSEPTAD